MDFRGDYSRPDDPRLHARPLRAFFWQSCLGPLIGLYVYTCARCAVALPPGAGLRDPPPIVKSGFTRTAAILLAIGLGALLPQGHVLAWVIRWLVMVMLFFVFLQTRFSRTALHRSHVTLVLANIGLAFVAWGLGWLVAGREIALAAFFSAITPTAIAAPVIISFLGGSVSYVVAAFLLSNVAIATLLPVILPFVLGRATPEAFAQVLGSVSLIVFGPMALARIVCAVHGPAAEWPGRLRNVTFGMWVTAMFLITSNASDFLRRQVDTPHLVLGQVAIASLLVCIANFAIGWWIGGREFRREASQALGQKNTTFTIYLALTYASPLVALGPTFYVVWHNLWNSWQLHLAARRNSRGA
jgi:BASS family bile acid:Na+ symporter